MSERMSGGIQVKCQIQSHRRFQIVCQNILSNKMSDSMIECNWQDICHCGDHTRQNDFKMKAAARMQKQVADDPKCRVLTG